jgi:predicted nucleotidyltransferase
MVMELPFTIDLKKIEAFCQKWRIAEFSVFGSALREDFGPESDVDILITFEPDIPWSLYDWVDMIEELKEIFGREVDLVEKSGLRNPFRRHEILTTRKVLYAA